MLKRDGSESRKNDMDCAGLNPKHRRIGDSQPSLEQRKVQRLSRYASRVNRLEAVGILKRDEDIVYAPGKAWSITGEIRTRGGHRSLYALR